MAAFDEFDELFGEEEHQINENSNDCIPIVNYVTSSLIRKGLSTSKLSLFKCPSFLEENNFMDKESDGDSRPRIIKWSDGSRSLYISAEKHYELSTQKLSVPLTLLSGGDGGSCEENTCLKSIANIREVILLRRNLSSDRSDSKDGLSRIRLATTNIDPEAEKQRLAKLDTERLREKRRRELKHQKERQMKSFRKTDSTKLSTSFLEEEDDDDVEDEEEEEEDELSDGFINDDDDEVEENEDSDGGDDAKSDDSE